MLPLSEIHSMVRTLDEDGRSPVADAVLAAWSGRLPGVATHWRSSASHVFAVGVDPAVGFLRLVPAYGPGGWTRARVDAVATLMHRLSEAGLPAAGLIRSAAGNLAETVSTPLGELHAVLVRPAPGVPVEVDDLTPSRARAWGAALARIHHESPATGIPLPTAFEEVTPSAFADDPPLAAAVRRLTNRLRDLPRDPARFGVVHGDFELDNLAWHGDTATAYDFDEAAHSWFVADIAFAVRNLGTVPAAFLAGYRSIGPLGDDDLAHLPLFAALHAAAALVRLRPVLDAGTHASDPEWLRTLRRRIEQHLQTQRATVLTAAGPGG